MSMAEDGGMGTTGTGGNEAQTEAAGGTSGAEGIGSTAGTETGSSGDCRGTGT